MIVLFRLVRTGEPDCNVDDDRIDGERGVEREARAVLIRCVGESVGSELVVDKRGNHAQQYRVLATATPIR
jgi:hypothetical protein